MMSLNPNSGFEHLPSFSVELPSCCMPPWCSLHFLKQAIALSHSMSPVPLISHSCSVLFHFPLIFPCPHPFSTFSTHFSPNFPCPRSMVSPKRRNSRVTDMPLHLVFGLELNGAQELRPKKLALLYLSFSARSSAPSLVGDFPHSPRSEHQFYTTTVSETHRNTTCIPFAICLWEHCKCTPLAPRTMISRNIPIR